MKDNQQTVLPEYLKNLYESGGIYQDLNQYYPNYLPAEELNERFEEMLEHFEWDLEVKIDVRVKNIRPREHNKGMGDFVEEQDRRERHLSFVEEVVESSNSTLNEITLPKRGRISK